MYKRQCWTRSHAHADRESWPEDTKYAFSSETTTYEALDMLSLKDAKIRGRVRLDGWAWAP